MMTAEEEKTDDNVDAMKDALKKANAEAAKYRTEKNELQKLVDGLQETLGGLRQERAQMEAFVALSQEGVPNPDALLSVIDLSGVTEDTDVVEYIQEKIGGLKKTFPQLFDKKMQATNIDASNKTPNQKHETTSDILAKKILGA